MTFVPTFCISVSGAIGIFVLGKSIVLNIEQWLRRIVREELTKWHWERTKL